MAYLDYPAMVPSVIDDQAYLDYPAMFPSVIGDYLDPAMVPSVIGDHGLFRLFCYGPLSHR